MGSAILLLLSLCNDCYAGSYQVRAGDPIGGQLTISGQPVHPYTGSTGGYGISPNIGGGGNPGSATAAGAITTVYQWVGDDPGDIAPKKVVISQTCAVTVSGLAYNKDGVAGSGSASADNGLGATVTPSTPGYQNPLIIYTPGGPQQIGTGYGGNATSTKYEVRDGGAEVTITCTPAVSVNVSSGTVDVSVNYSVNLSPVLVTLGGVTIHAADGYKRKVLTGQNVIGTLTVGIGTIQTGSISWSNDDYEAVFGEWNQNNGVL